MVEPFNPAQYARIYLIAGRTYGKEIKKAWEDADYWKAMYESWRQKIPKAQEVNQKHLKKFEKLYEDRKQAQKEAREAEERTAAATAETREIEGKLKCLRENLESKL